jgi:hypothetical protein
VRGVGDANGETLLGEFPQPTAKHKRYVRAQEQRKFAKRVDDDEETMSVEDAVPCDQRSEGVVDSGGTGKKRARLKIPNGWKTTR